MRNPHEVLRQKEMDLARVRQEVEVLRFVATLLSDRSDQFRDPPGLLWPAALPRNRWPLEVEDRPQVPPGS
jgi:hypothetical protein